MYLYNINNGKINVYKLIPDPVKLAEYKKKEMEKIPFEERVVKSRSNYTKLFEEPRNTFHFNSKELEFNSNDTLDEPKTHKIATYEMTEEEKIRQEKILNDYYNGKFTGNKVVKLTVYDTKKFDYVPVKYFLLTSNYKNEALFGVNYTMHDIISIPESLYLLHLIEESNIRNIYELHAKDISEQLKLFDIKKLPIEISLEELEKMFEVQLLSGEIEGIKQNIELTTEILHKTR